MHVQGASHHTGVASRCAAHIGALVTAVMKSNGHGLVGNIGSDCAITDAMLVPLSRLPDRSVGEAASDSGGDGVLAWLTGEPWLATLMVELAVAPAPEAEAAAAAALARDWSPFIFFFR